MEIASKAEPFLIHADFILPSGKGVVKMRVDEVVDRSVKRCKMMQSLVKVHNNETYARHDVTKPITANIVQSQLRMHIYMWGSNT